MVDVQKDIESANSKPASLSLNWFLSKTGG